MKLTTLCFLIRDDKVLLAMKKRGFGMGKFNGPGGKVESDESIEEAMVRETEEEIGVKIEAPEASPRALIRFSFDRKPEWSQECHIFMVKRWNGKPVETEEMRPEWFPISKLPFEQMWIDDPIWLPRFLGGESFEAEFNFNADGEVILSSQLTLKEK